MVAANSDAPFKLRRRGILWPAELDLGPICGRVGGNGRLADSHPATTRFVRRVLSRTRHWWTWRRCRHINLVWRGSHVSTYSYTRTRRYGRMVAAEIHVDAEVGIQRRGLPGQRLCGRRARIRD